MLETITLLIFRDSIPLISHRSFISAQKALTIRFYYFSPFLKRQSQWSECSERQSLRVHNTPYAWVRPRDWLSCWMTDRERVKQQNASLLIFPSIIASSFPIRPFHLYLSNVVFVSYFIIHLIAFRSRLIKAILSQNGIRSRILTSPILLLSVRHKLACKRAQSTSWLLFRDDIRRRGRGRWVSFQ